MNYPPRPATPRVDLMIGAHEICAVPVHLDGHGFSVIAPPGRLQSDHGQARLRWSDGRHTQLDIHLRPGQRRGLIADFDIQGVHGDWQPFLAYVAPHTR
ncbi:MAG: hypothetical protein O2894_08505 [Planctomycetota bacterium]|nr:hypothetical protein [Planctomycetota bacterium]